MNDILAICKILYEQPLPSESDDDERESIWEDED